MAEQRSDTKILEQDPPRPRSERSRWQDSWRLFKKNRLAIVGLVIFVLFFLTALAGLVLTSGSEPALSIPPWSGFRKNCGRPFSRPNLETLEPDEVPPLGIYLFGHR